MPFSRQVLCKDICRITLISSVIFVLYSSEPKAWFILPLSNLQCCICNILRLATMFSWDVFCMLQNLLWLNKHMLLRFWSKPLCMVSVMMHGDDSSVCFLNWKVTVVLKADVPWASSTWLKRQNKSIWPNHDLALLPLSTERKYLELRYYIIAWFSKYLKAQIGGTMGPGGDLHMNDVWIRAWVTEGEACSMARGASQEDERSARLSKAQVRFSDTKGQMKIPIDGVVVQRREYGNDVKMGLKQDA